MTGNSDLRERLGAVFFALIMVTSMVAVGMAGFAGSAAADNTTGVSTVDNGTDSAASPGETIVFENVTVSPEGSGELNITAISINATSLGPQNITNVNIINNSSRSSVGSNSSITQLGNSPENGINVSVDDGTGTPGIQVPNSESFNYSIEVTFNTSNIVNSSTVDIGTTSFNQSASDFIDGTGGSTADLTETTLVVGSSSVNNFGQTAADERVNLNVSFSTPADSDNGVNETSIDLALNNTRTGGSQNILVVKNGELTANATDNGTDFDANGNVTIDADVAVPEDNTTGYDLTLRNDVTDDGGNVFANAAPEFGGPEKVDMEPDTLNATADSAAFANTDGNTPAANDENATINVTIEDRFGNGLNTTPVNASVTLSVNDDSVSTVNTSSGDGTRGSPYQFNVTNTEAEDVTLTALDTDASDSQVNSDSVTQTFVPAIGGVDVSLNRSELPADGQAEATAELQLTDGSGNVVEKPNVGVSFSFNNGSAAGLQTTSAQTTQTNESGIATVSFNTSQSGVTVTATGIEQQTPNAFSASDSLSTTAGNVSIQSEFRFNDGLVSGSDQDASAKVATDHDLSVRTLDSGSNPIEGATVLYALNGSEITTEPSNANGYANTTITLPEETGDYVVNVSAGAFNASATSDAQVNVTATAENISSIQFGSSAPTSIAPESEDNQYTIETVDEFGNVNSSTGSLSDVTLTSDDTGVLDFDGSESDSQSLSSGSVSFNVDANGTGTATLSATIPDTNISNDTLDVTVAEPSALVLTPAHNVVTSGASGQNQAALEAQFVDADGDALGIDNQNVTFAKQSGSAAEVNQSLADTTEKTDGDGNVSIDVNGTSDTGETTFIALAENYSVQGTATVTTTGPADSISVTPESDSVATNNTVNVTAEFVDTEGRNVPLTSGSIQLSPASGSIEGSSTQGVTLNNDGQVTATFTYNASDVSAGTVTLTAIGSGVSGTASVTVTGADDGGDVPTDAQERALQITGKDDPANLTQDDVTAVITQFERGETVNGVDPAQDDVTTVITLFERN
jgi:surface glycoprotein (TIGR04207 family)